MADGKVKRHPIRGGLYGILLGLGLVLLFVGQGWAALGTYPPFFLLIAGILFGILWGLFAPAKKPKGEPPEPDLEPFVIGADELDTEAGAADDAYDIQTVADVGADDAAYSGGDILDADDSGNDDSAGNDSGNDGF